MSTQEYEMPKQIDMLNNYTLENLMRQLKLTLVIE